MKNIIGHFYKWQKWFMCDYLIKSWTQSWFLGAQLTGNKIHLSYSCGIFCERLILNFMARWNSTSPFFLFTISLLFIHFQVAQSTKHKHPVFNCIQLLSHLFFSQRIFGCASFLPYIRQLLFNSGRPDVQLITALPSRTWDWK